MNTIETNLTEAVAPLAGNFDLEPAMKRIKAAMAVGEIEARLNAAKYISQWRANKLRNDVMEGLQYAKSKEDVAAVLEVAAGAANGQIAENETMLAEILNDG